MSKKPTTIETGPTDHLTTVPEYIVFEVPVLFRVSDEVKRESRRKTEETLRYFEELEKKTPSVDLSDAKESMRKLDLSDKDYVRYV